MELELPSLIIETVSLFVAPSRLLLINRDPEPSETAAPIDSTIALELLDVGLAGVARSSVRVWVNGTLAFQGGAASEFSAAFAGPLATLTLSADSLQVVLHPLAPLPSLATVEVRVAAQTADGAAALDETYAFRVEDRTAPRLLAAQATSARSVRLGFDEPVAMNSMQVAFAALDAPAVPIAAATVNIDGRVVDVLLNTEMTPDLEYEVRAVGATDLFENQILAPYDRARFQGFRPPQPLARRFQLWEMLPKHNRRDDVTGDLRRFILCLQEVVDLLLADVDRWPEIFDLERAPPAFLELILLELGNPFPFELDLLGKRRLAASLVEMYQQKGTARGIQNAVRFFLGIEIAAITAFASDALVLGDSELGVDWVLGPSDRFARYAFNVEVDRVLGDEERRRLRTLVEYLKPAHTHFVDLVEPFPVVVPSHWELGISELGESSELH